MQSSDPERRQAAYRSVHLLGEEALPGFQQALKAARKFHERRLGDLLSAEDNSYRALGSVLEELDSERPRVYALIKTDYKKDPEKIRMLRDEMERITRLYQRAVKLSEADPKELDQAVDGIALALVEIATELKRFEEHHYGEESEADERPLEEQKRAALTESFDGEAYVNDKNRAAAFRGELEALAKVESDNQACTWANAPQKDFASHLNKERGVMGLNGLRLEERLSLASTGHSEDMRNLGFFSHTSPVEGKTSPGDRARKAGFKGGWSGENIFVGSPSHTAAYNGWFGSDGHRFIMFAKGPNLIGLGPVGRHWTLMTGRR
jgi:uncharacterized protein YkwD